MLGSDANTFWFAAGAALAALAVLAGFACTRKWGALPSPEPPLQLPRVGGLSERGLRAPAIVDGLCGAFINWLAEHEAEPDLWSAFDQLVRELLTEHLEANRVRLYHVRPGAETLQALSGNRGELSGPSSRAGVLGHVATSGVEYVAGDSSCGTMLEDLAARNEERWAWVWPVREAGSTIGVIGIGNLRSTAGPGLGVRRAVGQLLTIFWRHTACVERLRVVQRTDQGSGVLTRNDFFTLAAHALADSYRANEPVVAAVLALEGMRRLDDSGRWHDRDMLIEKLGYALAGRVRSDDLVGRFADDRFVILLRRLDSGLGRLIAEKLLATGQACLAHMNNGSGGLKLRLGLAGSGYAQPALEKLLVAAFDAAERARHDDLPIASDLCDADARPARSETTDAAATAPAPGPGGQA